MFFFSLPSLSVNVRKKFLENRFMGSDRMWEYFDEISLNSCLVKFSLLIAWSCCSSKDAGCGVGVGIDQILENKQKLNSRIKVDILHLIIGKELFSGFLLRPSIIHIMYYVLEMLFGMKLQRYINFFPLLFKVISKYVKCLLLFYCLCLVRLSDVCVGFVNFTQLRLKIIKPVILYKSERHQEFLAEYKISAIY